jgi:Ser/Thr protein kinase RdoA (MazF antagonist)
VTDALEAVALEALRAYDVEVADCAFAAQAFNAVFRVNAADGSRYALRVGSELRIHADGCEEVEAAWVNALHAAGFPVARAVPARDGAAVVDVGAHRCVLFDWVSGRSLREHVTPELVRAAGVLTATLHERVREYPGEQPAGALRGDRVLSFSLANRLDELRPRFGSALPDAVGRAQEFVDTLWRDPPHAPHLLHGDVNLGNVMADGERVALLDFQDLTWGFEVQDVVIAMLSLPHRDAFRAGYASVRAWPDVDSETWAALEAARHLNILNFGLSNRKAGLEAFVARHAEPIVAWMAPGASRA